MEKISPELDYSTSVSNHSTIVYRNTPPQGSNTVSLSQSSVSGPTTFLLSPTVYNMAKSRLNFTLSVPAQGAGNASWIRGNLNTLISRIQVIDSNTSNVLCDVSNFDKYCSMLSGPCTDLNKFLSKSFNFSPSGAFDAKFIMEDIEKSRVNYSSDFASAYIQENYMCQTGASVDFNLAAESGFNSRRQFYISPLNTAVDLNVSLPFSGWYHTVLATDKNLYTPSNIEINIWFNSTEQFGYLNSSLSVCGTVSALTGSVVVKDILLQMAVESNLSIVSQTINKVMSSGLSLPIPYPTLTRTTLQGANPSFQLQLTKSLGNRILYIATSPFYNGGKLNYAQVHSTYFANNLTPTWAWKTFNTFINNQFIKYANGYNVEKGQDWEYNNRVFYEGSSVQGEGTYRKTDFVNFDSFFGDKPIKDLDPHSIDGLSLSDSSSVWSIQAELDSSRTLDYFVLIQGQKQLTISNQGISVM